MLSSALRKLAAVAAVACIIALVILSWLPKEMETRTGMPGQMEHVAAYLGTAFISCLAWRRPAAGWLCALLIGLAGILEIGQFLVPGRTSQLVDFAASSAGALLGIVAALPLRSRFTVLAGERPS